MLIMKIEDLTFRNNLKHIWLKSVSLFNSEYSSMYIYFEFKDDSVAFVYQPGVFNVRDSINTYFKEKGFPINFGFSPTNIKKQYEFRNSLSSVALFDSTSRIEFPFKPAVFEFTKPRVITVDNLFYKTESSFFEKKNW